MRTLTVCLVFVIYLLQGTSANSPPDPGGPLEIVGEPRVLHSLFRRLALKTRYVDHHGGIHSSHPQGCTIRVDATYSVSDNALYQAATTISRMVRHMSASLFSRVCSLTSVGVFTRSEGLTVYPEYAHLKNPTGCGSSCSGSCHASCTFDGRKYSTLTGLGTGGNRVVVLDDNVLCDSRDPYHGKSNVLVHEYARTIMEYAIPAELKSRIHAAYNSSRDYGYWPGYQMTNAEEFWAVATSSYFNAEHSQNTDMNYCGGTFCSSEHAARYHIYDRDAHLYNLLAEVYGTELGNLGPCTSAPYWQTTDSPGNQRRLNP